MRRKAVSTAINPIVVILLLLVALSGLLIVGRAETGILNKGVDSGVNGVQDLFSICGTDLGTVDFKTFMAKMNEIHNDCKADKNKCGSATCKKMTLKLTPAGSYHEIGWDVLKDYEMDYMNSYLWIMELRAETKIFCEEADYRKGFDEIGVYYSDKTYIRNPEDAAYTDDICAGDCATARICRRYGQGAPNPFFAIADGSTVKMRAIRNSDLIFGENTDLKLEISGGQFTNKQPAPAAPTCGGHSECQPPLWGGCVSEHCQYSYCKRDDITPKCKTFTVTCSIPTCETPPTTVCGGADYFNPTANGFKTRIDALKVDVDTKLYVQGEIILPDGTPRTIGIKMGDEQWFKNDFLFTKTSSNDPDAKVSLGVESIVGPDSNGKYMVNIVQGCY